MSPALAGKILPIAPPGNSKQNLKKLLIRGLVLSTQYQLWLCWLVGWLVGWLVNWLVGGWVGWCLLVLDWLVGG